jgi:methyl-accepting chemotaxis protein
LVCGIVLAMGCAILAYVAIRAPVERIRPERASLSLLENSLQNLRVEVGKLMTTGVKTEAPAFKAAVESYNAAYKSTSTIKILPSLNPKVAEAVSIIQKVREMSDQSLEELSASYAAIADSKGEADSPPLDFASLLTARSESATSQVFTLMMFNKKVADLDYLLGIGDNTIREQFALIDRETAAIETRATLLALIIALIIAAGTLAAAFAVAASISSSIVKIDRSIAVLKTGDLSEEIPVTGRDELGRLAENLNSFLAILRDFYTRIGAASTENVRAKDSLASAVNSTMSANEEIGANTRTISERMASVGGMTEGTRAAVGGIGESFSLLLGRVEAENGLVESTVSAVTQMLASIANISRITQADRNLVDGLVKESERGRAVFEEAFDRVAEATKNVDAINEMARVIKDVADKTNLLAMNAAIEASHAGQYGKGFAVVASEISKLAETANRSSAEITKTIGDVTVKMKEAGGTREVTANAFKAITGRIGEVSRSVTEIYSNMEEMQAGGTQILEAMSDLKSRSSDIAQRSREFEGGTGKLREATDALNNVVSEVVSNLAEIGSGLSYIGESVSSVSEMADRIGAVGVGLDGEIRRFRIRAPGEAPAGTGIPA